MSGQGGFMKIPKEYILILVVGLFLLAYLLDSVVNPLELKLTTPYQYLQPEIMWKYPFTTISIFIKGLGLLITPLFLMSFVGKSYGAKAGISLVLGSLVQLYALQDVVTHAEVIPLEWSLSLSLAGLGLLVAAVFFFLKATFFSLKQNLTGAQMEAAIEEARNEAEDE